MLDFIKQVHIKTINMSIIQSSPIRFSFQKHVYGIMDGGKNWITAGAPKKLHNQKPLINCYIWP